MILGLGSDLCDLCLTIMDEYPLAMAHVFIEARP